MQYTREIPTRGIYDLVVCGGGMTGFACAVSAARKGLKTVILERSGMLGGVGTAGLVCSLLGGGTRNGEGVYQDTMGGIFTELSRRMIACGGAVDPAGIDPGANRHGWYEGLAGGLYYDDEIMKLTLDDMCRESGAEVLFFTDIVDAACSGRRVQSVIAHNKSGLFAVEGRCFADTTGDADIASMAGCPTALGRDEDHLMAPASLEMMVEHVDGDQLEAYIRANKAPRFRELIRELRAKGLWTFPYDIMIAMQAVEPDIYLINTIRQVGVNGIDGDSVSASMTDGRQESFALLKLLRDHFPGFAHARLRAVAPVIGIRETRRIRGAYILTVEDLLEGARFADTVARSTYGWDLPDPHRPSLQPMHGVRRKSSITPIPYRCLLPQGIDNLIVAGRSISVERPVLGPVRVMAPCMGMGQAAGAAASIAVRRDLPFARVDAGEIRELLERDGCRLSHPD